MVACNEMHVLNAPDWQPRTAWRICRRQPHAHARTEFTHTRGSLLRVLFPVLAFPFRLPERRHEQYISKFHRGDHRIHWANLPNLIAYCRAQALP